MTNEKMSRAEETRIKAENSLMNWSKTIVKEPFPQKEVNGIDGNQDVNSNKQYR